MHPQQGQLFKGTASLHSTQELGMGLSCLTQLDMHVVV